MSFRFLFACLAALVALPLAAADWDWNRLDEGRRSGRTVDRATGETFIVTIPHQGGTTHTVQRIRADGSVAWRREHTESWGRSGSVLVRVGAGRVCVGGAEVLTFDDLPLAVACYRVDDGALLWRTRLLERTNVDLDVPIIQIRSDGSLVAVATQSAAGEPGSRVHHFVIAPDGTIAQRTTFPSRRDSRSRIGEQGIALFLESAEDAAPAYRVLAQDGTTLRQITAQELGLSGTHADLAPDGSVYVVGNIETGNPGDPLIEVRRYDTNGGMQRVQSLGQGRVTRAVFRFNGSDVYLSATIDSAASESGSFLHALTTPTWRRADATFVLFDPATRAPLLLSDERFRIALQTIDRATGAAAATRRLALACTSNCLVNQVHLTDDGSLRVVHAVVDVGSQRDSVYARHGAFAPRVPTRVDQPGLRGAWYATYTSGQGFLLDYLPQSRTIFMPWFTYATTPGDSSGLRWYTLQGDATPGATSVALGILENTGGAFAAGSSTTARTVGTAQLRFYDCTDGQLDYAFDDGQRGSITLTRLTPATEDCVRAGGSVAPGTDAPSNGFDRRQSGAWFVPDQSGQGLMFSVQPGGLFFGAWFTYDADGVPDDPTSQHWFSLQGDLKTAAAGGATATIFRTIAGTLDNFPSAASLRVGETRVRFTACDRAELDYAFDDSAVAGAFRARTGTLSLQRIGGCAR